ncbi:hypothetical protein E4V01_01460 [Methylorubrum sp. Q1]|uniref:DUF6262 family protein n=1 Tax=Methylorubrum TaxID=2282523 RepID=UPI001075E570|nr:MULTISPECIES: DUF6262 family protein [Methylorubrum]MDF9865501.1 hypothetical protein [Methylorubrum pseudosasae]MDH6639070.1 hypothetical protein [Methylobacterium sp. SuP10 SLI 274]MDH6668260.1 hypothetical protein [Methylorubrum zatmanii]MCP1560146.1 hypothetical protein [Methylorubrum extorquens]TFZ61299.1 hypothetical protein E4V01_01460 [Methylorubrum sp. Q1]
MSGASGREIGERHVAALRAWLDGLEAAGEPLPTRNGRINLSAIAIACGFDRQTLYKNPAARALLEEAVGRLGTGEPAAEEAEAKPQTDRRDRRILQLEQQNAALRAEVRGLREQLARYRHVEDVMISGRGVRS